MVWITEAPPVTERVEATTESLLAGRAIVGLLPFWGPPQPGGRGGGRLLDGNMK